MNNIIKQIEEYAQYPDNWDGQGAKSPAKENVFSLISLINELPKQLNKPTPMLFNDGRVGLFWDNDQYYIDIELEDSQYFSIFGRSRITQKEIFDDKLLINSDNIKSITTNYLNILNKTIS